MDIRDIDGLWCDDITFCQEECDWTNCPRNQKNIRNKTIPHSFSVVIPDDCPKKEYKEMKCRIMDDVGNIIDELTTKVAETEDEFVFQTVSKWLNNKTQMVISKQELIDALTTYKKFVRCKDCKHYHNGFNCDLLQKPIMTDANWYCADGERR